MRLEDWLSRHQYLWPVADFHAQVSDAANAIPMTCAQIPDWRIYSDGYQCGVPLLRDSQSIIDSAQVARSVTLLLEKLVSVRLPNSFHQQALDLRGQFKADIETLRRAIVALFDLNHSTSRHPGFFRYLGWTVLARHLEPLVASFECWRDEDLWSQSNCPICGSGPSMAQLVGKDPGRRRLLVCGCCRARWRFARMACPFCEGKDEHQRSVFTIRGEQQIRIDYCDSCHGYLKTYDGEGSESILLADWTSLHVDLLAKDRGLKRSADSLFEL